ncbi:iron-containing redox enzyme family protein [Streptomyces sp. H10-C2]|uniref:iron-containing redox enzyme family protein n=1 Tax=unclassified Streptomyces TaxID=2593676 RepID=UPI0024B8B9FA|nr:MULTISPECIES: iron-containing redox enzyme family protein [unclassified Streptomyces]MDJ0346779.1 iron-containing redox enzyme family protein [Streptomyces sp. PH10-H1]MDJ0374089.1 iron-containing redox enzyme family protein [Streptomyces sp. H10-C2]
MTTTESRRTGPLLPQPRGLLSVGVLSALRDGRQPLPLHGDVAQAEPYGDDLHLALYLLYELHYRGFHGVDDDREWDARLLHLRQALENRFLTALRADSLAGRSVEEVFDELLVESTDHANSVSHYLQHEGELWQIREYAALRSLYHLKEADPHVWVIPRLQGRAKAAMVAVEYDEFGAGRAENVHAQLFADLMHDLQLNATYGHYLDAAPAEVLATVNVMSLFGLHRALRGALVGHFACVEVTSSPGSFRLARAIRRTGAGPAAERFYAEHVEADAVHEQVVRRDVVGGLLADEPGLAADVAFGADATTFLEERLSAFVLHAWRRNSSALRAPLLLVPQAEDAPDITGSGGRW